MAANWKMHKTPSEAHTFTTRLVGDLAARGLVSPATAGDRSVEVVICPPFPALGAVAEAIRGAGQWGVVGLGGQNLHWEDHGAFTGEVSAAMLADIGCHYVIVGHSERRRLFGETDDGVARKMRAARRAGLTPILCVGETLEARRRGETETVILRQLDAALEGMEEGPAGPGGGLVVAYEPVWAIGTGENASGDEAARVVAQVIRERLGKRLGPAAAGEVRVLYGGSVSPDNIGEFMAYPTIDGALVGGASLKVESFTAIVAAGRRA